MILRSSLRLCVFARGFFNKFVIFSFIYLLTVTTIPAQDVLRGELRVELEPIYGAYIDEVYPLDKEGAYRRALQEAAMFFSAQIYGWSFHYDVGERARGIEEIFELTPLGEIRWGDPRLFVTDAHFVDREFRATSHLMAAFLSVWVDYRPTDDQRRRLQMWKMGNVRSAQAIGYSPLGGKSEIPEEGSAWLSVRKDVLEDSARAAVRAMLQGSERNRPKEVTGLVSLESFPAYFMDQGRWAARARFKVEIKEIVPFAVY